MKNIYVASFICVMVVAGGFVSEVAGEEAYGVEWVRQFGAVYEGTSQSVAVDGLGNVYNSGYGRYVTHAESGDEIAYVAKHDSSGNFLWNELIDTSDNDQANAVAVDGHGNVFVSGENVVRLDGSSLRRSYVYLSKYDSGGDLLWTEQPVAGYASSVAVDGYGNAYVCGMTGEDFGGINAGGSDAFLAKYDSFGSLLWSELLGTVNSDDALSVAVDGIGNVFIGGRINAIYGSPYVDQTDAYLAKYDSAGNLQWMDQFGTDQNDSISSVAVDGLGNIYVGANSGGSLNGTNEGSADTYLAKYNADGNQLWMQQLGTSESDSVSSVAVDGLGNIFMSGITRGDLGGINAGRDDSYLAKYDMDGSLMWVEQFGTNERDWPNSLAVDGVGNVYISGSTAGDLGGVNAGGGDAFLIKFAVPEPGGLCLLAVGGVIVLRRRG